MRYGELLLDHFDHPRHAGRFEAGAPRVGTGLTGAPEHGGVLRFQIRVDGGGIIRDTRFLAYGCGATIAAGSLLAERVRGLDLDAAARLHDADIAARLGLPAIRIHCAVLAETALRAAIDDYRARQAETTAGAAGRTTQTRGDKPCPSH